jgi:hypothetical protein
VVLRRLDGPAQHFHPGRPMPLEKRHLWLHRGDERGASLGEALAEAAQPRRIIRQAPTVERLGRRIDADAERRALFREGQEALLERQGHYSVPITDRPASRNAEAHIPI